MNIDRSHCVLVTYGHKGLRSALNVAEAIEPIAEVQLRSYEQSLEPLPQEPDVALCVVTDNETLDLAHQCQVRLEDIPTFMVDGVGGLKIELNGYAGMLSSSPEQVLNAVRRHLISHTGNDLRSAPKSEPSRAPRRIASPFDHTLARAAGGGQTPQSTLIAAARQLSWDLRADRVEVFLGTMEKGGFRRIYAEPKTYAEPTFNGKGCAPSVEVIRLIKKRSHPVSLGELEARASLPLYRFLSSRNLNLLLPLTRDGRLLGWLAFGVEASRCTDDLLDDLQVAGHLLTTSVAEAFNKECQNQKTNNLFDAFAALKFGILTISQDGQILSVAGTTSLLGSEPHEGDHFKAIHNSRAREVVANALRGSFIEKTWTDFESQATISCLSTSLADGKIAVFWGPQQHPPQSSANDRVLTTDLKELLDSLPVPVVVDSEISPGTAALPRVQISDEDGRAIRDCALQAQAKNVKALRLRWGKRRSPENAVLFYEAESHEGGEEFADDIQHAVRFSLEAA